MRDCSGRDSSWFSSNVFAGLQPCLTSLYPYIGLNGDRVGTRPRVVSTTSPHDFRSMRTLTPAPLRSILWRLHVKFRRMWSGRRDYCTCASFIASKPAAASLPRLQVAGWAIKSHFSSRYAPMEMTPLARHSGPGSILHCMQACKCRILTESWNDPCEHPWSVWLVPSVLGMRLHELVVTSADWGWVCPAVG